MTGPAESDREVAVLDASAMVDLLAGTDLAAAVAARVAGTDLRAPALFDAEVLSALARLERADDLTAEQAASGLTQLAAAPVTRSPLPELLIGAWARRASVRVTDALYVELATQLDVTLLTTDGRLARRCPIAELITG